MSNDPLRITLDKLADLLRGLGLDPVDLNTIRSISIQPSTIEVVRYRADESGRRIVLPGAYECATETVTIAVVSE